MTISSGIPACANLPLAALPDGERAAVEPEPGPLEFRQGLHQAELPVAHPRDRA